MTNLEAAATLGSYGTTPSISASQSSDEGMGSAAGQALPGVHLVSMDCMTDTEYGH